MQFTLQEIQPSGTFQLSDVSGTYTLSQAATDYYELGEVVLTSTAGVTYSVGAKASDDTGTVGQISIEDDYLYVCVNTNEWKRIPLFQQ